MGNGPNDNLVEKLKSFGWKERGIQNKIMKKFFEKNRGTEK